MEVLISTTLIDSNITNNKYVAIKNVLKEYEDMKGKKILIIIRRILYISYQYNTITKNFTTIWLSIYKNDDFLWSWKAYNNISKKNSFWFAIRS